MIRKFSLLLGAFTLFQVVTPVLAQETPATVSPSTTTVEELIAELSAAAESALNSESKNEKHWAEWWTQELASALKTDSPWQALMVSNEKVITYLSDVSELDPELKAKLLAIHQSAHDQIAAAITGATSEVETQRIIEAAKKAALDDPLKELKASSGSFIGGLGSGAMSLGGKISDASPLSEVTSLGGLNPIAALSSSLDNTTTVIDNYPEKVRKETEIILANDSTKQALDSVERFSHSSIKFAEVSETLPDEIRKTLEELADDQPQYQGTIREINTLTATAGTTTEQLNNLTQSVDQVVKSVAELSAMFPPDPNAPTPPPGRPFDITEYTASLQELNVSLQETKGILDTVDGMIATDRVDELMVNTTRETNEIVDNIKSAVITVLVAFFALASIWILLYFYVKRKLWVAKS